MLPQAARDLHLAQQRLIAATLGLTRREWAGMGADFDASWARIGPRIALLTASAQMGAARNGAASVPMILAELGQSVDPWGEVDPRGFAGIASDGRPLDSLLYGGVTTAKTAAHTMSPVDALKAGGKWLDMAIHTQVADASRGAAGVAIAARPKIGWVRMVNPPCCSRCAMLSGKWFRYNEGFDRHPRCDCTHIPAREMTDDLGFAPDDLIKDGKVTGITKVEKQAIADGGDAIAILNADRRIYDRATGKYRKTRNDMWATEGTTRHGYASHIRRELDKQRGVITKEMATKVGRRGYVENYTVRRISPRPTVEAIYKYSGSREEAIKLMAQNGYIVGGSIRDVAARAL